MSAVRHPDMRYEPPQREFVVRSLWSSDHLEIRQYWVRQQAVAQIGLSRSRLCSKLSQEVKSNPRHLQSRGRSFHMVL